ncbi:MAG TPA: DNA ligase D [Chitinophagaceae bacterium]|nr:DNA ligase D [Chitinophagaceae bacterium]
MPEEGRKVDDYIVPMMAKETDKPFDSEDWLFEIKWDGYRAIAEINGKNIRLYSRHGNSFLQTYAPIAAALKKIKHKAIIDGEIVVLNEEGNPDFQLLQQYQENPDQPIAYYIFDLLSLKGKDTTQLTLTERKELLQQLIPENSILKFSGHVAGKGKEFFKVAVQHKLEGIIAKRTNSKYYPGLRTADWVKIKTHRTQEVIIAGYTQPTGTRNYFGAIILAIRKKGELLYAGHSGSGFNQQGLKDVWEILQPLITDRSPFQKKVKTNTPVTWVKPVLVADVKYSEWTQDGILRHPIFLRLRTDKTVNEANMTTIKKATPTSKRVTDRDAQALSFGRIKVNITNRDKIFWPDEGYTKGDVIDYYQEIADYILPYLKNRPQSLLRNPNGIKDRGFFHKDAGDEAPAWVKSVPVYSESNDEDIDYIICNDKATLAYLNNLGCIELNPWNSTIKSLDKPDYMIVDIDPSKNNTFDQVVQVAQVIKKILDKAGAESYCKTSGATGLHVFVPMGRKYTYDQVKDFCHIICRMAQEQLASFTTLERNLKKRGSKHIYMDYLQNRKGQTISSVYSLRPKPGATVSTPLQWKEVKKGLSPAKFTIKTIHKRLQQYGDLFAGVLGQGIDLKKCLEALDW